MACAECGSVLGRTNSPSRIFHAAPGVVVTFIDLIDGAARLRCPACLTERTVRFIRIEMAG